MREELLQALIVCPGCRSRLRWQESVLECPRCSSSYRRSAGVPRLLDPESERGLELLRRDWGGMRVGEQAGRPLARLVKRLLPPPAPFLNLVSGRNLARLERLLRERGAQALLLDLGSGDGSGAGIRRLGRELWQQRTLRLDVDACPGVQVVAVGERLPLADASVDAVMAKAVLEHVPNAAAVLAETLRVLKPGGWLYLELPLLYEYHPNPGDYLRLTHMGLERWLGGFEAVETGTLIGPAGALASLLAHTLALGLGLGRLSLFKALHPLCTWLTLPLALADLYLARLPAARAVAHHLYAFARRPVA